MVRTTKLAALLRRLADRFDPPAAAAALAPTEEGVPVNDILAALGRPLRPKNTRVTHIRVRRRPNYTEVQFMRVAPTLVTTTGMTVESPEVALQTGLAYGLDVV
ncbi:hypothetical protein [Deinococcus kurensis]|uniref:hypothetical protein n=1 Tax=Deinococcus kurensis TaxID=2662757 RepID=UPI0012D2BCF6|nr:hypothetical protein [Deinococcus kurensis]